MISAPQVSPLGDVVRPSHLTTAAAFTYTVKPQWLEHRIGLGGSIGMRIRLVIRRLYSDHGIFSMVILSLPLIQEVQLSVSGKRMYTLRGFSLPSILTALNMTPFGWLGYKTATNKQNRDLLELVC